MTFAAGLVVVAAAVRQPQRARQPGQPGRQHEGERKRGEKGEVSDVIKKRCGSQSQAKASLFTDEYETFQNLLPSLSFIAPDAFSLALINRQPDSITPPPLLLNWLAAGEHRRVGAPGVDQGSLPLILGETLFLWLILFFMASLRPISKGDQRR